MSKIMEKSGRNRLLISLCIFTSLALIMGSSISGIFLDDGGQPYSYNSIQGNEAEIYGGAGVYRYDDVLKAYTMRGFDWANLFISAPLLILGWILFRKKSFRSMFLLSGIFLYLAYGYLIGAMGNSYNGLFLVWTCMYSLGGLGVLFLSRDKPMSELNSHISPGFPVRPLAIYMFAMGSLLPIVYLIEIIGGWISVTPPASLSHYTTLELAGLEIGIMVPLHFIGGILLLKRKRAGFYISISLVCTTFLMFVSLTWSRIILYLEYSPDYFIEIMQMGSFALVALIFSVLSLIKIK